MWTSGDRHDESSVIDNETPCLPIWLFVGKHGEVTIIELHVNLNGPACASNKYFTKESVGSNGCIKLTRHSTLKNQNATVKAKGSMDVNDHLLEKKSSANTFRAPTSKARHTVDKINYKGEKPDIRMSYLDEGDVIRKLDKHTNTMHKSDTTEDGLRFCLH